MSKMYDLLAGKGNMENSYIVVVVIYYDCDGAFSHGIHLKRLIVVQDNTLMHA